MTTEELILSARAEVECRTLRYRNFSFFDDMRQDVWLRVVRAAHRFDLSLIGGVDRGGAFSAYVKHAVRGAIKDNCRGRATVSRAGTPKLLVPLDAVEKWQIKAGFHMMRFALPFALLLALPAFSQR